MSERRCEHGYDRCDECEGTSSGVASPDGSESAELAACRRIVTNGDARQMTGAALLRMVDELTEHRARWKNYAKRVFKSETFWFRSYERIEKERDDLRARLASLDDLARARLNSLKLCEQIAAELRAKLAEAERSVASEIREWRMKLEEIATWAGIALPDESTVGALLGILLAEWSSDRAKLAEAEKRAQDYHVLFDKQGGHFAIDRIEAAEERAEAAEARVRYLEDIMETHQISMKACHD